MTRGPLFDTAPPRPAATVDPDKIEGMLLAWRCGDALAYDDGGAGLERRAPQETLSRRRRDYFNGFQQPEPLSRHRQGRPMTRNSRSGRSSKW